MGVIVISAFIIIVVIVFIIISFDSAFILRTVFATGQSVRFGDKDRTDCNIQS